MGTNSSLNLQLAELLGLGHLELALARSGLVGFKRSTCGDLPCLLPVDFSGNGGGDDGRSSDGVDELLMLLGVGE